MKCIGVAFAVLAGITGLVAAWCWHQSSQVQIDPGWGPPGSGRGFEPSDEADQAMSWAVATIKAFGDASDLNKKAALWTAASVLLSALSAIIGNWL